MDVRRAIAREEGHGRRDLVLGAGTAGGHRTAAPDDVAADVLVIGRLHKPWRDCVHPDAEGAPYMAAAWTDPFSALFEIW